MKKVKTIKKLIEVALPIDDINKAAIHEKAVKQGHPASLHLYWARRPLAAARAILFAQIVNDPSETIKGDKRLKETKIKIQLERERLFEIIRELVKWENINNKDVLGRAQREIEKSFEFDKSLNPNAMELFKEFPVIQDPFAGGGAIPLEAQRLGFKAVSTDLNPLPLLLNTAMTELPSRIPKAKPIGPEIDQLRQRVINFEGGGLASFKEDLLRYGELVKSNAYEKIREFYPSVDCEGAKNGTGKIISWIWARTVTSPNPAAHGKHVPIVKSFILSKKKGKCAWVEYNIDENMDYAFTVKTGKELPDQLKGTVGRKGAECILTGSPIPLSYIREQGKNKCIGFKLMATVVEGERGRIYLSPTKKMEELAESVPDVDYPTSDIEHWAGCTNCVVYGYEQFHELFSKRQLLTLTTFSDEIKQVYKEILEKGVLSGWNKEEADNYATLISIYLTFALDKMADLGNAFCAWEPIAQCPRHLFGKQAIPMVWDFAEANPFSNSSGSWTTFVKGIIKGIGKLPVDAFPDSLPGIVEQFDAQQPEAIMQNAVISTDPPYYDNVPYSNLSDFFYIWMRRTLRHIAPKFLNTIHVPKSPELVANQFRHGGKEQAERFFLDGMTNVMTNMANNSHPAFPVTIYYAFKASETRGANTSSSGWETFIEAVINSGFSITGTWPLSTENATRMRGQGANALASSIVLVCRKRNASGEVVTRREFQRELREELPSSLESMIGGDIGVSPLAPVDLAQAAIGPGMAIFSKYDAILESDGSKMSVHDALILINRAITEYLNPDSGNFDSDTLFCDDWFSQYGWSAGSFGEADTLARAKGTSVDGVRDAGVIESGAGKVRLLKWSEYPSDWDPKTDNRTPVWEACHQMIRVLNEQGEAEAGALLARMPEQGEYIRQLAYHLYTLCERKKWAEEARAYNELIGSWHAIVAASQEAGERGSQSELGFDF